MLTIYLRGSAPEIRQSRGPGAERGREIDIARESVLHQRSLTQTQRLCSSRRPNVGYPWNTVVRPSPPHPPPNDTNARGSTLCPCPVSARCGPRCCGARRPGKLVARERPQLACAVSGVAEEGRSFRQAQWQRYFDKPRWKMKGVRCLPRA